MNVLRHDRQVLVVQMLVEGCSIRAVSRVTGVHRDTISRLLLRVGDHCQGLHDQLVQNMSCVCIQADEIWCRIARQYNDAYTFVALDPDTKLVISYLVGRRDEKHTRIFIDDLAHRVPGRVQITTDGFPAYLYAIQRAFGDRVAYATLVKTLVPVEHLEGRRKMPARLTGTNVWGRYGGPDIELVSTSLVERQNLTMRMHMRRYTRHTNAFSKRMTHLRAAVALHFAWYNFVRIHGTLGMTPAMVAGVTSGLWRIDRLLPPRVEDAQ